VLAPYLKAPAWTCEGKRVVVGQRLIQGAPDIFLGWCSDPVTGDYYVRQLRDMKGVAALDPAVTQLAVFADYCGLCGWALAQAHAKSGDPASIAGYLGKSDHRRRHRAVRVRLCRAERLRLRRPQTGGQVETYSGGEDPVRRF